VSSFTANQPAAPVSRPIQADQQIEVPLTEDKFAEIYKFFEAKSICLLEGRRCIICSKKRVHMKFAEGKGDKFDTGGSSLVQHQDRGHSFEGAGLCQSHLYPRGVLKNVCKGNNRWIFDGVSCTSCTPNACTRQLICSMCEPVTSKLEDGLIKRMESDLRRQYIDDDVLFSILAYRSSVFSLHHYQEPCCNQYRADIRAILQYGWSCHYTLTRRENHPTTRPPVLLYIQSPSDEIPDTLHLPAVCELDLTALQTPPLPEPSYYTVVAIYGCIPPYHYTLLRDPNVAAKLQSYSQQITLCINKKLTEELNDYYVKNDAAKCWLKGQRKRLGQSWWPILTFGQLKCCLKIRIE